MSRDLSDLAKACLLEHVVGPFKPAVEHELLEAGYVRLNDRADLVLTRAGAAFIAAHRPEPSRTSTGYVADDRASELRETRTDPIEHGSSALGRVGLAEAVRDFQSKYGAAPEIDRDRPTDPAPPPTYCAECGAELEPVRAIADGEPTLRGCHPCPKHPLAGGVPEPRP